MNAVQAINNFVDSMLASQTQFTNIKAETENRNNAVKECISRFQASIESMTREAAVGIKDTELREISHKQVDELTKLLDVVAASLEATRKGMKFINEYEDSFNIAVFGKVKAGKSYTGNFVMGNVIRDLGIKTSYDNIPRPKVKVIDRGQESEQAKLAEFDEDGKEGFRVDPNEATSTIQIFRLGGMVWIDTPGIGSVTFSNEILAKSFVDNADLIVYMSNSHAAGTQQDFAELEKLYAKKKRFLLLLTRSDTVEVDEDDDGNTIRTLVAKSYEDRKSMEDYIWQTLDKNGITMNRGTEFLTISTKLALEGLRRNDEAMFTSSNLARFLEVLVDITKNEAAKLKLATPSVRINAMIDEIVKGLRNADSKLEEHMQVLASTRQKLSERNDYLQSKMLNDCITGITSKIEQKAHEIESGGKGVSASELQSIVADEIYRVVNETCAKEFSGSEAILSGYSSSLKVEGIGDMDMRRDTITYTRKKAVSRRRDPDGVLETVKSWFGAEYYTTSYKTITETRNVDIGVNLQQVMSQVRASIDKMFSKQIPAIMRKISDNVIAPVEQVRENAGTQINAAIRELESLKIKL